MIRDLQCFPLLMLNPGRNQVLTASMLSSHSSRWALARMLFH